MTEPRLKPAQPDSAKATGRARKAFVHERQRVHLRLAASFDPILNASFPAGHGRCASSPPAEGGMVRTSGNWLRGGKSAGHDDAPSLGWNTPAAELENAWMGALLELNSVTLQKIWPEP